MKYEFVKLYSRLVSAVFLSFGIAVNISIASELNKIEVNGAELSYVEMGDGPLMILAHGAISDHRRWVKDHMPLLAENYRVIAYTMRYHGDHSQWDEKWPPLSMELYADDLAAFIKTLDAGPAHLVGWSMGANVAHRAALKYPNLVRSAYLFEGAAALELSDSQSAEIKALRESMLGKSFSFAAEKMYSEAAGALLDAVVAKDGFFENLPPERQKAIGSKGMVLADYFDVFENPVAIYTCNQIKENEVPTRLVVGENTTDYFSTSFENYHTCFGADNMESIAEANHVWPGAKYEEFVQSVHSFASKY